MPLADGRQFACRKQSAPAWALSDLLLQEVIVGFLQVRAKCGPGTGTPTERLTRAREALFLQLPKLNEILDKLCHEYTVSTGQRKRELEIQIENLDTTIRLAKNPALLAAVVYFYYRAGLSSVGVS